MDNFIFGFIRQISHLCYSTKVTIDKVQTNECAALHYNFMPPEI